MKWQARISAMYIECIFFDSGYFVANDVENELVAAGKVKEIKNIVHGLAPIFTDGVIYFEPQINADKERVVLTFKCFMLIKKMGCIGHTNVGCINNCV